MNVFKIFYGKIAAKFSRTAFMMSSTYGEWTINLSIVLQTAPTIDTADSKT